MIHKFKGFSVDTDALKGYTKTKFIATFKGAGRKLFPLTLSDVWDKIKKDIPKNSKK